MRDTSCSGGSPTRTSAISPQPSKKAARSSSVAVQGRFLMNTVELPLAADVSTSSSPFFGFLAAGVASYNSRTPPCVRPLSHCVLKSQSVHIIGSIPSMVPSIIKRDILNKASKCQSLTI